MTESYHAQHSPVKKFCPRCKHKKLISAFRRNRISPDGHQNVCKDCCNVGKVLIVQPPLFILSKVCTKCGKDKEINQFSPNKYGRDGYKSQCHQCREEYNRPHREANREYNRNYSRQYDHTPERTTLRRQRYQEKCLNDPEVVKQGWQKLYEWARANPLRVQESHARRRARQKGTFVEPSDYARIIEQYGYQCHICSKAIDPTIKKGNLRLTFDHVIPLVPRPGEPQGEHCTENIRPAHKVCNARKSNKPLSALTEWERQGP